MDRQRQFSRADLRKRAAESGNTTEAAVGRENLLMVIWNDTSLQGESTRNRALEYTCFAFSTSLSLRVRKQGCTGS